MTALLSRVAGFFYAPPSAAEHGGSVARSRATVAPSVAVLTQARDVLAAGGAVALAVARDRGAAAAVLCVWTGEQERGWNPQAPARPAAHRLASALARRGHAAGSSGRLVTVWLDADEAGAAAEAARVGAACGAAPVVLAIGGARGAQLDAVVRGCDLAVVATRSGAGSALESLALAGAEALGVPAIACEVPATPVARMLASGGARLSRPVRAAMRPAVEALR